MSTNIIINVPNSPAQNKHLFRESAAIRMLVPVRLIARKNSQMDGGA